MLEPWHVAMHRTQWQQNSTSSNTFGDLLNFLVLVECSNNNFFLLQFCFCQTNILVYGIPFCSKSWEGVVALYMHRAHCYGRLVTHGCWSFVSAALQEIIAVIHGLLGINGNHPETLPGTLEPVSMECGSRAWANPPPFSMPCKPLLGLG